MQHNTPRFWQSGACFFVLLFIAVFFIACAPEDDLMTNDIGVERSALDDEVHDWTHGDWTWRVVYEARYALSEDADGGSDHGSNTSNYIYGDWNYVASDWNAYFRTWEEATAIGDVGSVEIDNVDYYLGGWCTFFVRLVLYRSVAWNFDDHYTMPGHYDSSVYTMEEGMTDDPDDWDEGWVIRSSTFQHFAIADERDYVDSNWGWWIIDANWLRNWSPHYDNYIIGKHFLTDSQLSSYNFYGWNPSLGTDNE